MWILPTGRILRGPEPYIDELGNQHTKEIFTRWSISELSAIGIHTYTENTADLFYYKIDSHSDVIEGGHCHRTYVFSKAQTNSGLRKLIVANAKSALRGMWRECKADRDFLLDCDPLNSEDITACDQLLIELRTAAQLIREDIQAITTYAEAIAYLKSGLPGRIPTVEI